MKITLLVTVVPGILAVITGGAGLAMAADQYACQSQYEDKAVQEGPLWTESFDVDVSDELPTPRRFEVAPNKGEYYAALYKNGEDEGLAAYIWNNETHESSIAVYDKGSRHVMIQLKKNSKQALTLACTRK